jgi:uncharacterized protein YacL
MINAANDTWLRKSKGFIKENTRALEQLEIKKYLRGSEEFEVIYENFDILNNYIILPDTKLSMSLLEAENIEIAAEKYIEKTRKEVEELSEKNAKERNTTKILDIIAVGLLLLSGLLATNLASLALAIVVLIGLLVSFVLMNLASKHDKESIKYVRRLGQIEMKLRQIYNKTKNKQLKEKILSILNKIDRRATFIRRRLDKQGIKDI